MPSRTATTVRTAEPCRNVDRGWVGLPSSAVLLIIASYFLLIHPKMAAASDLRSQKATTDQANSQLRLDIAQLKAQFATLPAKQAELAVVQQQMPSTPEPADADPQPDRDRRRGGREPEQHRAGRRRWQQPARAGPQPHRRGLYDIPVTIAVQGDFASNELFLQKLQTEMRRAFLVQSISIGKSRPPRRRVTPRARTRARRAGQAATISRSPVRPGVRPAAHDRPDHARLLPAPAAATASAN